MPPCRGPALWKLHSAVLRRAALRRRSLDAVQQGLRGRHHIAARCVRECKWHDARHCRLQRDCGADGAGAMQHCALRELHMAGEQALFRPVMQHCMHAGEMGLAPLSMMLGPLAQALIDA